MTCMPAALNGVVDADDGGAVRLRTDTTPLVAVLVIPEGKYAAWKSMFPAGLNKAVESKYNKTRRLWFVMTGIPADAPKDSRVINTAENVSVFWSGFPMPIDAGDWQPNPPETLPEVSYADIMRLVGLPTTEPTPPAPEPDVPFDDGTPHLSPHEEPPSIRRIEYPICFYDPAGIGGAAAFAYDDAQKRPCDQSGRSQAPAEGLLPFDKIILKKIDNTKMFLRVSLGGAINHADGTREIIPRPAPIVILDYDHVLNQDTGDYADGVPDELRDEMEYLKQSTYCEFSKSGAGIHAFCIDNLPEPLTKPDGKPILKIKADSKPEIFRGDGQVVCTGWRISDACDDIHEIDISAIYTRQLGKSSVGKVRGRKKAGAEASPEFVPDPVTEPEELTDEQIADLKGWIRDEAEYVANVLSEDFLQPTKKTGGKMGASELMMSIMDRICLDMAPAAISAGIPYHLLATPAHVERLWKCSEVYQTYYGSGPHKYNDSKVNTTARRAIDAGRERYIELYTQLPKKQETA